MTDPLLAQLDAPESMTFTAINRERERILSYLLQEFGGGFDWPTAMAVFPHHVERGRSLERELRRRRERPLP